MTAHLLLVMLGPVQDFIAQARRTRDLWFGSHLLSELSRRAARALVDGGAQLIFPALTKGHPELEPCSGALREDRPPLNVANKLLAEVPAGIAPEPLARAVRAEVMRAWREEIAAQVKQRCGPLLAEGIDAAWAEQIETFVELMASWAPLGDYAGARRQVEQAVAARKLLRGFTPWRQGRGDVPKSSLDGARETVLAPPGQRPPKLAARYRIADGEELDAVGLVKRAGGEPEQFVPIFNVAFASWLDAAGQAAPEELARLRDACRAAGLSRVERPDLPCARPFRHDAGVLLRGRWAPVLEEHDRTEDPEAWGRRHVAPLLGRLSEPCPYVACLVADGDRMGQAIDRLRSAAEHRSFTKALSGFAEAARRIVEQERRGALVYAGGDDVLAFLALPEALACADQLRRAFAQTMAGACWEQPLPTLSIGLGIGHVMESMGELRWLGREAERRAKRDRNALAVLVEKRSGAPRLWSDRWDRDPLEQMKSAIAVSEQRLSTRKVHEIERLLHQLAHPGTPGDRGWARVLAQEVRRSLDRVEGGGLDPGEVGLLLDDDTDYPALHERVGGWVNRLLIARTFVEAVPRVRRSGAEVAA